MHSYILPVMSHLPHLSGVVSHTPTWSGAIVSEWLPYSVGCIDPVGMLNGS